MKSSYHINRKIVDKLVKKYQQYKKTACRMEQR